jgi:hypothetical protein
MTLTNAAAVQGRCRIKEAVDGSASTVHWDGNPEPCTEPVLLAAVQINLLLETKVADRALEEIRRREVGALHQAVGKQNGPYLANCAVSLLRAVINRAIRDHEMDLPNPAKRSRASPTCWPCAGRTSRWRAASG